jgi:DNA-binding IclR family transcriptional regulator
MVDLDAHEPVRRPPPDLSRSPDRMDPSAGEPDRQTVLGKAVTVLHAFGAEDRGLTLAELGRRTGIPKGTLHRVANDLVAVRLLDRDQAGYRLGGQLFQLGMRASAERGLLEVATPFMEDLYELTHETVHLGVREDTEVVYVAKIGGHRQAAAPSRIGGRMPLHCTAIGKALLAHAPDEVLSRMLHSGLARVAARTVTAPGLLRAQLEQVAESGLAFEYEESAVGIACVAAPVVDPDTGVVAALSVAGPVLRFRPQHHGNQLRAAAAGISATLARRPAMRGRD